MPYQANWNAINKMATSDYLNLTTLQRQAINYATSHSSKWVGAREIALHHGYPNGQYFRGVLASLHKRGLLTKKEV
jgi:hypothetical protein